MEIDRLLYKHCLCEGILRMNYLYIYIDTFAFMKVTLNRILSYFRMYFCKFNLRVRNLEYNDVKRR